MAELLGNAAVGLMEMAGVRLAEDFFSERKIALAALDREMLLVDFLQELLISLELHQTGFAEIKMAVDDDNSLKATVMEASVLSLSKPVKAVTYNNLHIVEVDGGLETTVVFDV